MEKSHVQVHGGVTTEKVAGTFLIQLFYDYFSENVRNRHDVCASN